MRAIFIDAEHRQVSEVQIENELQAFYDKIGCRVVQIVYCGMDADMLVDENGRLRDWRSDSSCRTWTASLGMRW